MRSVRTSLALLLLVLLAPVLGLAAAGCGGGCETCDLIGGPGGTTPTVPPDFSLQDVNPNSNTWQAQVSPRQLMGSVSAWYFGHST